MANTYTSLGGLFTAIANAIRAKKGTTDTIVADNFPSEIESIVSQPSLQSKTVSPSTTAQTITPDSGYDGLSQVVVNAISPTKGAQTYTPTTTDQTISSGRWLTGAQTIKGDANLVASNIKSGVSIFGVSGTAQISKSYGSGYSGSWSVQSDGITLTIPENHTFGELTAMGVEVAVRDTNGNQISFIISKFTDNSIQYHVYNSSGFHTYTIADISSSQKTIFFSALSAPTLNTSSSPIMDGYITV